MATWNVSDCGCYAGGEYGHEHVRAVLADLSEELGNPKLAIELRGEMSDDASEEYEAIDLLNTDCDGCHFEFVDDDLMLVADSEEL